MLTLVIRILAVLLFLLAALGLASPVANPLEWGWFLFALSFLPLDSWKKEA